MQKSTFKIDDGLQFGTWEDKTSQFMYFDCMNEILSFVEIPLSVADYGGANGNLKKFIPNALSIDIDETKNPDVVDNILTHEGNYDLIIIRYVLHYLTDYEICSLFEHLAKTHQGKILVIQFCNNDLKSKYRNSLNEHKYFRTESQMEALLPQFKKIYSKQFFVDDKFYQNRLKINNAISHFETLNAYLI